MFAQRSLAPVRPQLEATERLWSPPGLPAPSPDDQYVVIDDLSDGVVKLVSHSWPMLDAHGRLKFAGRVSSSFGDADKFLAQVIASRQRHGQEVPERPLRIGDVFRVRGKSIKSGDTVDVSRDARRAAKAAMHAAAAPKASSARSVERVSPEQMGQTKPAPSSGTSSIASSAV